MWPVPSFITSQLPASLHCRSYQHTVELFTCELAPPVIVALTNFHYITAGSGHILVTLTLTETIAAVCRTEFHR